MQRAAGKRTIVRAKSAFAFWVVGALAFAGVAVADPAGAAPVNLRISQSEAGVGGALESRRPTISADGQWVAFDSGSANLLPTDANGAVADVYVKRRTTGAIVRVSVSSAGAQGNGASDSAVISDSGRFIAFVSRATNLVADDTNTCPGFPSAGACPDVFVHDRDTDADGVFDEPGAISTARVSVSTTGAQGDATSGSFGTIAITPDARYVVFESAATNLVGNDENSVVDIFRRDRDTDGDGVYDEPGAVSTTRVSLRADGTETSTFSAKPDVSADGRWVTFQTSDPLLASDTTFHRDIYARDAVSGTVARLSVATTGAAADWDSSWASISDNARWVTFSSNATNLSSPADPNIFVSDVFVIDRDTDGDTVLDEPGAIRTRKVSALTSGVQGNGNSETPFITADGRFIAFRSSASNLGGGDTGTLIDAFVADRLTLAVSRRSVAADGGAANGTVFEVAVSRDNQVTVYSSTATNVVTPDTNGTFDVFARVIDPPAKCAGEVATIVGTAAAETIVGTASRDVIVARGGSDIIRPLGGQDVVCGGPGNDTIEASDADDILQGDDGNDTIAGGNGKDVLRGGNGDDTLDGGPGAPDRCEGGGQLVADTALNCESVIGVP